MLAFAVGLATTPAGVSGAVLLLRVEVSILGVPSPAVTPTNLLYNVVATPGGLSVVLGPLGAWLAATAGRMPEPRAAEAPAAGHAVLALALGLAVGVVGGIYGIGGGSILAPILLAIGLSVYDVAGAALAATFLTSVAGVVTYALLQVRDRRSLPDRRGRRRVAAARRLMRPSRSSRVSRRAARTGGEA